MDSETKIPDEFITTEPATEDVTALRPSNEDTLTFGSEDIPSIFVRLVEEGEEAVPVAEVDVEGEIAEVEIFYKESDETDVPFKPVSLGDDETPKV